MSQITTLLFVKYETLSSKTWAFGMMQFAHRHLQGIAGQSFYKLMGSGKGHGFNPWPDWSVYALMQVWDTEADATHFFEQHPLMKKYQSKCAQWGVVWMKNFQSHGLWSGAQPFMATTTLQDSSPVAVITRATIHTKYLRTFWKYVPATAEAIKKADGLLFSKGIGEVPVIQMATFSIWENLDAIKAYAYQQEAHKGAIRQTRKLNWYKEELFARFVPYKISGNWTLLHQVKQTLLRTD